MRTRSALYVFASLCAALSLFAASLASRPTSTRSYADAASSTAQIASATLPAREPTPYTALPDGAYQVEHVVDGDTFDVAYGDKVARLRLIGMDTPEVVDPRKPVQCFGKEASAEGKSLLTGKTVRLESDAIAGTFDKYGRTLEYAFLPDGVLYNKFMIAQGFAHEYDYNNQKYKYRTEFKAAQADAKAKDLGFWSPQTCSGNTTKPALQG